MSDSMPDHAAALAGALLDHYDVHRRDMPWRDTTDPYAIWVSEVMLQQTRVDTVVPYWERWLDRFPTVSALAEAELDEVLKLWEGLGYYSRARNLHGAARMVRERYGGRLPAEPTELRELPGVGEYTAGAVASIAYAVPVPAVDGNVRRVLSRLYDLEAPTAKQLRERAASLVPAERPGDFNQALMELGATICTPRAPGCDRCPVARWCRARERGVQEERPRPTARKAVPDEEVDCWVLVRPDARALLVRRPPDGLLGGLWEFPTGPRPPELGEGGEERPAAVTLPVVRHAFTHKRVTYRPTLVRLAPGDRLVTAPATDRAWVALDGPMEDHALPVAQQKIAAAAVRALDDAARA